MSSKSPGDRVTPSKAPTPTDIAAAPVPRSSTPRTPPPPTLPLPSAERTTANTRQRVEEVTGQEWYAAPELFDESDETTIPIPRNDLVPRTAAVSTAQSQSGNGKSPPTLTMLSAYGEPRSSVPPEGARPQRLLVGLLLLVFFGLIGFGGWYWWTHRAPVAQPPSQADSSSAPAAADSSSSASLTTSAPKTVERITSNGGAEEEWKRLRERRVGAKPSETKEIIAAFEDAETKYPRDYRFPYERAKLSIKGITSHHEAFGALSAAADKAIENGKSQEMLDSLMADKDGDFYKLSRGHHEWQALVQALSSKDKSGLNELHH
ncbi:MAG TPA: hypothetical protein VEM96_15550 [Pyrinomonadaceae bacterium]|nr:hypothetical protein [Pyrinomonadaceae bacterium]